MLHVINHRRNTFLQVSTRMKPPFLPFDEPNLCNDYISMDPEYNDGFCFLNQVDSNIDLLDNVLLTKVVAHPTKKPRNVDPHKSKSEKTTKQKEITPKK